MLYASELGLVVENVEATVKQIEKSIGLKPYRDISPEFAAIGDAHALLIVVKKGRLWFASNGLAASPFASSAKTGLDTAHEFREGVYSIGK